MTAKTKKMVHLEDGILSEVDEKFSRFRLDMLTEPKQQLKIEAEKALKNKSKKGKNQTVQKLQQNFKIWKKQMTEFQQANELLGQYGRRV